MLFSDIKPSFLFEIRGTPSSTCYVLSTETPSIYLSLILKGYSKMKCHEKKSQTDRMSRIKKVAIRENESVNLHNPYGALYNTTMLEIVLQCRFFIVIILTF